MRWFPGDGALWRVRVDLFTPDGQRISPTTHRAALDGLLRALSADDGQAPAEVGIDEGTGITERPVVGLLFWVQASSVGEAADLAVVTATAVVAGAYGAPVALYDVVVIPRDAVVIAEPTYPAMPD